MAQNVTPPFTRALVDTASGRLTREGYAFLVSLNNNVAAAGAGVITTAPGSGLTGGGAVSDGVNLAIGTNAVTNSMIRQSLGTSVIGRFAGTNGNVADIQAVSNGTVLQRLGNQLVFTPDLDVTSVRTDSFRIDQTPVAEVVVCTHTLVISLDGTSYKIPCVAA
jgi:hypothetical protein